MKATTQAGLFPVQLGAALLALVLIGAAPIAAAQGGASNAASSPNQTDSADKPSDTQAIDAGMTRLKIRVTDPNDKPVGNASVYVRYYTSGGFMRHDKLEELNFKTNQDGSVKVPEIPQGKVLIQVIAKGWHTYGKWYDISQSEQSVPIKLDPPPHWY